MSNVFSNIPFFRILIPFVSGILVCIHLTSPEFNFLFLAPFILIPLLLRLKKVQTRLMKYISLISTDVFFFLLAIQLVNSSNLKNHSDYYGKYYKTGEAAQIIATVNDLPVEKEKFIKCYLKVIEINSDAGFLKTKGNIIAYFKRSVNDKDLTAGATVFFKAKLLEVDPPKNPFEFDYKNYLSNKHIYHTSFIEANSFEILNVPVQLNPIWYNGLLIKQHILRTLKQSALTPVAYGICAALLTGYDDEIDKQVVESFSHSGTLHVLSVSGLHTGLIYLVLSFLFDLIDKKKRFKIFKFFIITVLLWAFALITGFSAPVLRAVIMFNLLGFGRIFYRADHRVQINILLVSAFILLCYDPFFITDVGFLLSYFAVFGLIYFQPKLMANWQPTNYLSKELWKGTTASFAATISTLPLTLFYFKQFPIWFFICNILVVPASFIILLLAFLLVLKVAFAAAIINYLVSALVAFITFFNSAKYGFIDGIDFSFYDALFLLFFIIVFTISIQLKSYRNLSFCLILLIWWQASALVVSYNSKTETLLAVYHVNKNNFIVVKNRTRATINHLDSAQFIFHIKPHITSFNNSSLTTKDYNHIVKGQRSVLVLNKKDHWPAISFAKISLLVLANNFKISGKDLEAFSSLKTIVMDGSNSNYSIKKVEELCRKFGIELIRTKQQGAYIRDL